jgi:hypothetical protein
MARIWKQDWLLLSANRAISLHRNRDDVVEFSRFYNTKNPGAQRVGQPRQAVVDSEVYNRICDSVRGIWGQ